MINGLERDHDVPIKFMAVFLDASDANMETFAPISYGFGNWGSPHASTVCERHPTTRRRAHALGRKWMEPVAYQDARPRSGAYAEAGNTETGRATWTKAIEDHADYVQIVTWNDYSESTHIAPSMAHGSVLLDISAYYIDWFTNGKPPAIKSDHLYLTHRIHAHAASATSGINNMANTLGRREYSSARHGRGPGIPQRARPGQGHVREQHQRRSTPLLASLPSRSHCVREWCRPRWSATRPAAFRSSRAIR